MKKFAVGFVVALTLCAAVYVFAQSYGAISIGTIAPTVANCPAGQANAASLCVVGTSAAGYAFYVSYNAGTYQLLVPAATGGGVTSFNGRTGAVTLSDADVTATGLKVITTVTSTATSTPQ